LRKLLDGKRARARHRPEQPEPVADEAERGMHGRRDIADDVLCDLLCLLHIQLIAFASHPDFSFANSNNRGFKFRSRKSAKHPSQPS